MKKYEEVKVYKEYTLHEQGECYGTLHQSIDKLMIVNRVPEYQHECSNCGEKVWLGHVSPTIVYEEV